MRIRAELRARLRWRWLCGAGVAGGAIVLVLLLAGAFSGGRSPDCVPVTVNRSDILPGTSLAVSPLPDSRDASPATQISLLGVRPEAITDVVAVGSKTGAHAGRLEAYSQGDGASFVPSSPFRPGETVQVSGRLQAAGALKQFSFSFVVARPDPLPIPAATTPHPSASTVQYYRSAPGLQLPKIAITADSRRVDSGDLFAALYGSGESGGPLIFNDRGQPVWFQPLPVGQSAANLQVQEYHGRPVLTWWQGDVLPQGFGEGEEVVDNASYQRVAVLRAGNGDSADLHDFQIQPDNVALITVFRPIECNLVGDGGSKSAALNDAAFQEIDMKTGLVRREWDSVNHVPVSDTYLSAAPRSLGDTPFDYFHLNSLDPIGDDQLLISARSTWAIYRVDQRTGQVLKEIGGRQTSYKPKPGGATAYQHDATLLPNGTISVFDNGGVPMVHTQSRAVILRTNPKTATVTEVHEYEHEPELKAGSQGDVELLPDGDVFVGWGSSPYFSEYTRGGTLVFDGHVSGTAQSYRVYRFPWKATPLTAPSIAVGVDPPGSLSVYASWNGSTAVRAWRVLTGASAGTLRPVATTAKTGFQTLIAVRGAGREVRVEALAAGGKVLGRSRLAAVS
jgi:hypothetical protein